MSFLNSLLSRTRNRNGCKPSRAEAQGLSSCARPSTGPFGVAKSTSTIAPGLRGFSTRSKPPVIDTTWSFADEQWPSGKRMVVQGIPGNCTRMGRSGDDWGEEELMSGKLCYGSNDLGEITKERVRPENGAVRTCQWRRQSVNPHKRMEAVRLYISCIQLPLGEPPRELVLRPILHFLTRQLPGGRWTNRQSVWTKL